MVLEVEVKTVSVRDKLGIDKENVYGLETKEVFYGQEGSRQKIDFKYKIIEEKKIFRLQRSDVQFSHCIC